MTTHCVEAYVNRVKPGTDPATAKRELLALIPLAGDPVPELDWKHPTAGGDSYLEISDGIALVLKPTHRGFDAVTVVVRGSQGEYYRQRKLERKKRRKAQRRARSHYSGRHNRNARRTETYGEGWPE